MTMTTTVNVYTDGGTRGNPGRGAWAFLITDKKGREVCAESGLLEGMVTNNESEYTAILKGISKAIALGANRVRVFSDSEFCIRQLNGENKIKAQNLRKYHAAIKSIKSPISFNWLNRENPLIRRCDAMADKVLA